MTFEEREKVWRPYLKEVASQQARRGPFSSAEDLYQALLLGLWRCHEKYQNYDEKHFRHVVLKTNGRVLASHFRTAHVKRSLQEESLEVAAVPNKHGRNKEKRVLVAQTLTSHASGSEFYRSGIRNALEHVTPGSAIVALECVSSQKHRPRLGLDEAKEELEFAVCG